jgi:hypothetical protein
LVAEQVLWLGSHEFNFTNLNDCLFYFYVCTLSGIFGAADLPGALWQKGGDPPISKCSGVSPEKTVVYMHGGSCTHGVLQRLMKGLNEMRGPPLENPLVQEPLLYIPEIYHTSVFFNLHISMEPG